MFYPIAFVAGGIMAGLTFGAVTRTGAPSLGSRAVTIFAVMAAFLCGTLFGIFTEVGAVRPVDDIVKPLQAGVVYDTAVCKEQSGDHSTCVVENKNDGVEHVARFKKVPPNHFTIIDGKVVEIKPAG